ncbi:MAG: hypothetical protein ACE5KH_03615, partial [Candidatus Geothermarchaeales archaeon]
YLCRYPEKAGLVLEKILTLDSGSDRIVGLLHTHSDGDLKPSEYDVVFAITLDLLLGRHPKHIIAGPDGQIEPYDYSPVFNEDRFQELSQRIRKIFPEDEPYDTA